MSPPQTEGLTQPRRVQCVALYHNLDPPREGRGRRDPSRALHSQESHRRTVLQVHQCSHFLMVHHHARFSSQLACPSQSPHSRGLSLCSLKLSSPSVHGFQAMSQYKMVNKDKAVFATFTGDRSLGQPLLLQKPWLLWGFYE